MSAAAPSLPPAPACSADLIAAAGPERLINAVAVAVNPRPLHVEHFSNALTLEGHAFEVEAVRSAKTVAVASGQSIADALMAAGIEVNLSCEQGVCGACLTPVLDGEVDHRDAVLSDVERAERRQIALCCSRAKGNRLALDI